ncbi:unnamed protein product [Litomosoides sigmodontis]|uniref:Uncharacterized protein n=1 Tax=Litomosoides sigmodontis TaxID=42156 RepID=A0A3P6TIT5_LITSI|nr:unnamed protein product [Litomosoides sigmodontis]
MALHPQLGSASDNYAIGSAEIAHPFPLVLPFLTSHLSEGSFGLSVIKGLAASGEQWILSLSKVRSKRITMRINEVSEREHNDSISRRWELRVSSAHSIYHSIEAC